MYVYRVILSNFLWIIGKLRPSHIFLRSLIRRLHRVQWGLETIGASGFFRDDPFFRYSVTQVLNLLSSWNATVAVLKTGLLRIFLGDFYCLTFVLITRMWMLEKLLIGSYVCRKLYQDYWLSSGILILEFCFTFSTAAGCGPFNNFFPGNCIYLFSMGFLVWYLFVTLIIGFVGF